VGGLATGASSFSTFFQVAPRIPLLLLRMRPTWHLDGLASLTVEFLRRHGIRGLIWDVDGTLTGDRRRELAPQSEGHFRALLADASLKHVVLSNAGEDRYRELGTMFPVPILRAYRLKDRVLYRRLRGASDSWSQAELEGRLREGARVLRKPSAELVNFALRELECSNVQCLMIGDQYLTDVAGANLAGVRSVKLPTLARETFRPAVRFSQALERGLYSILYGRGA
jgi:predicted HAD superfamily phosphohydrolase YqeG